MELTSYDTCAIATVDTVRSAALLFDRVYVGTKISCHSDVPEQLAFNMPSVDEEALRMHVEERRAVFSAVFHDGEGGRIDDLKALRYIQNSETTTLVDAYFRRGIVMIPVYGTDECFAKNFPTGKLVAYRAAFENIPLVLETDLTWDQIIEFRSDPEAVRKYRRLKLWLHDVLQTDSVAQARDAVAQKIDDYEWAIRKHGLTTVTGAMSQVMRLKNVIVTGAAAATANAIAGELWSLLVGGLVVAGQASIWIAERLVKRKDIEWNDKNREMAYLLDVRRRVGRPNETVEKV